ncbi:MAG: cupin protein [Solirubrobacteraceae bacterium]|nr:cupin protein [Solirubrobacteraceae bacterium]
MDAAFVVNVADARHVFNADAGAFIEFEPAAEEERWKDTGVNITILQPGLANGRYHAESTQEDFLVLHGECLLLLEGEERRLRTWDYVHCPPGAEHIFVGAEEPCAVLMIGARREGDSIHYPVNELAARHGASVSVATDLPAEAYADHTAQDEPVQLAWPMG